jgi:2-hydroxy-6-oxonona-2,4-dienedioate hydrolase
MGAWSTSLTIAGLVVAATALVVVGLSQREVRRREVELARAAQSVETRYGVLEYAAAGEGPVVLVVHGAGGGFDQGLMIARSFAGEGYRFIAPSRFGYLGSALPDDASTAAQADALADLLDRLGVARVAVLAFSGGAPPSLQFAQRYPERTQCLALLSPAPFTPYAPPRETRPIPDWLYQALFGSDVVYWSLAKTNRGLLEEAFDARRELRQDLAEDEAEMVRALVDGFLPASRRVAGVLNEAAAIDPTAAYELEDIQAPVLVVHARDDRLNAFTVGQAIAERMPNARLIALDRGGHLLLGSHAEVRSHVGAFFAECDGAWLRG